MAAIGNAWEYCGNAAKVRYPIKLAPLVTPIVDGEARWFRITPWRIHPASDKQTPTMPPQSIRGRRTFQIISRDGESALISP